MPEITDAERIVWQRQACTLLDSLLTMATKDGLPAIAWTVSYAGAGLNGACQRGGGAQLRADFAAWKAAITRASGRAPDHDRGHQFSGEMRLVAGWEHLPVRLGAPADQLYPSATVTLTASIWPADEDEEAQP